MRPLIIAALLCTYSACSCDAPPCTPLGTGGLGGAGGGGPMPQIGYVGQPVSVDVTVVENTIGCSGQPVDDNITGVVVEVLDPGNQKVAATHTGPVIQNGEATTTVTFTPTTPGPYHLAVRFTPSGGTEQRDIIAAVDKRMTAAQTFPLGSGAPQCDQIDFDGNTLLCHDTNTGNLFTLRLDSNRQGVVAGQASADAFALTDGRVWVHDPLTQSIALYGLGSDGSLALQAQAAIQTTGIRPKILAQDDQALFIDDLGFQQLSHLPDGGISSSGVTPVGVATGGQWVPGAGATVFSNAQTVCGFALSPGVATEADAGSCTSLQNMTVVGYDDDGVWWVDPSMNPLTGQTVFVAGWHASQNHATTGAISVVSNLGPPQLLGEVPAISVLAYVTNPNGTTLELLVPRFDGNLTWFEHYPTIDQSKQANADSRYLWYIDNNVLTYYPR